MTCTTFTHSAAQQTRFTLRTQWTGETAIHFWWRRIFCIRLLQSGRARKTHPRIIWMRTSNNFFYTQLLTTFLFFFLPNCNSKARYTTSKLEIIIIILVKVWKVSNLTKKDTFDSPLISLWKSEENFIAHKTLTHHSSQGVFWSVDRKQLNVSDYISQNRVLLSLFPVQTNYVWAVAITGFPRPIPYGLWWFKHPRDKSYYTEINPSRKWPPLIIANRYG